jgi:hypothetical protein
LLKLAMKAKHLGSDTTYKLILQGYPVFVLCVTDNHRHVHPVMVGIATNETAEEFAFMFISFKTGVESEMGVKNKPEILVADGANAITNGFKKVFGDHFTRVMCWAHVYMAVEKRLCKDGDEIIKTKILADLASVQLATSDEVFAVLYDKFVEKCVALADQTANFGIIKFLEYFHGTWYESSNNGWY